MKLVFDPPVSVQEATLNDATSWLVDDSVIDAMWEAVDLRSKIKNERRESDM